MKTKHARCQTLPARILSRERPALRSSTHAHTHTHTRTSARSASWAGTLQCVDRAHCLTLGSCTHASSPAFAGPLSRGCSRRLCKSRYCRAHAMALVCVRDTGMQWRLVRRGARGDGCRAHRPGAHRGRRTPGARWHAGRGERAGRGAIDEKPPPHANSAHLEVLQTTPLCSGLFANVSNAGLNRLQLLLVLRLSSRKGTHFLLRLPRQLGGARLACKQRHVLERRRGELLVGGSVLQRHRERHST